MLNSMNLEDGEERVAHICGLAKKYGAAVVAGTIDEDKLNAMARTADRKLSIAKRMRDLAVGKYGLRDEDILFDPLVLPISTGIEEDRRNALETIEGTRRSARNCRDCHTVVGLSNVSFGLKPAARVVLNSAFPARAARGRPDGGDCPCQQNPSAQQDRRRKVERRPGPDLRPPPRGI
jgi:5-methyltetrahydrofolate--homocysteine methyltransferase